MSFNQKLNLILDQLFDESLKRDWSLKDIARFSKLGYSTVLKWNSRIVKTPRLESVFKMGRALGFEINLTHLRRHANV